MVALDTLELEGILRVITSCIICMYNKISESMIVCPLISHAFLVSLGQSEQDCYGLTLTSTNLTK